MGAALDPMIDEIDRLGDVPEGAVERTIEARVRIIDARVVQLEQQLVPDRGVQKGLYPDGMRDVQLSWSTVTW